VLRFTNQQFNLAKVQVDYWEEFFSIEIIGFFDKLGHWCESRDLIHRSMSDFAIHLTASMIGEAGAILSRTRGSRAPKKPVLRILARIEPLAKLASKR
jgi:hypothetical protein